MDRLADLENTLGEEVEIEGGWSEGNEWARKKDGSVSTRWTGILISGNDASRRGAR